MVKRTDEQDACVQAVLSGKNTVKILALAGTGKTTTLREAADDLPGRGVYITFNRKNADDARPLFPDRVDCRTAHSLAYRSVGFRYQGRLKRPARLSPDALARGLKCERATLDLHGQRLDGVGVAQVAWRLLQRFIKTPDRYPSLGHLPPAWTAAERLAAEPVVLPVARRGWDDLQKVTGLLPFSHDTYLKIWQLKRPTIAGDFIFFDEAQDADPVMLAVLLAQEAQQVFVGDPHQAIYEWRGAVNAMEHVAADVESTLTGSFRFGQAIAEVANTYLAALGADVSLRGVAAHTSRVGPISMPKVTLCRTNSEAVRGVIAALEAGQRPHLCGGVKELIAFADSAERLKNGTAARHPLLSSFRSWREVQTFAEDEEGAGELPMLVRLVDDYGERKLLWALRRCKDEANANRVYSTAHKAKGREWPTVTIASDFSQTDLTDRQELRLVYMALTRAQKQLDCAAVPAAPKRPLRPRQQPPPVRRRASVPPLRENAAHPRGPVRSAPPRRAAMAQGGTDLRPYPVKVYPNGKMHPKTSKKLSKLTAHKGAGRTLGYWQPYMRTLGYVLVAVPMNGR
jgi:hypothetical protein